MAKDITDYELRGKIASGAFGEVHLAVNKNTDEKFVAKLEKKSATKHLKHENQVYKLLQRNSTNCISKVHSFGYINYEGKPFLGMVMDRLGPSIEDLFLYCGKKFSLKTTLMVGDLMLSRIEFLHYKHFIHRDIKPDNFCFGYKENVQHNLFVIDFGLTKLFRNPKTYIHILYKENKTLLGTARYCSLNTHLGIEQSRRDDIEALAYCLIYLMNGRLPWQNLSEKTKEEKYNRIRDLKESIPVNELCKGLPDMFAKILLYAKRLDFEEMPNYLYIRNLMLDTMKEHRYVFDYEFDWEIKRKREGLEKDDSYFALLKSKSR